MMEKFDHDPLDEDTKILPSLQAISTMQWDIIPQAHYLKWSGQFTHETLVAVTQCNINFVGLMLKL